MANCSSSQIAYPFALKLEIELWLAPIVDWARNRDASICVVGTGTAAGVVAPEGESLGPAPHAASTNATRPMAIALGHPMGRL